MVVDLGAILQGVAVGVGVPGVGAAGALVTVLESVAVHVAVAEVTVAVAVDVALVGVRLGLTIVGLVGHSVAVEVAVARVSDAVTVGVSLVRIGDERAVVAVVADAVVVVVLVAVVPHSVAVGVDLGLVGDQRAHVLVVEVAVAVHVGVAQVAHAVVVVVRLVRVGNVRAVVELIDDAVAVGVCLARVPHAVGVAVQLVGVGEQRAIVGAVGDLIVVVVGVTDVAKAVGVGVELVSVGRVLAIVAEARDEIVDRQTAARYGINASEILDAVAAMGGRPVGTVFEGQARFVLQVRLERAARVDPEAIGQLLIAAPDGRQVPLGQVARIVREEGPAVVSRESAQRRRTIQVNVRGRDLAGFVAEAQQRVRDEADLPPGYFMTWGGQFENLEAASSRLAIAVPAALILIFLLLYTMFGAARPALIIYLNIPMAAVGGVAALWARGMPFSISAAVGFIALSGIAVLNGVVMVSYIRDLQRDGLSLWDATERGAQARLRAVLMTALTDGIGFLPMALSGSAGAEVQRPLATVVIGGLFTATLLTLFVLPVIYSGLGGAVDTEIEDGVDRDEQAASAESCHMSCVRTARWRPSP